MIRCTTYDDEQLGVILSLVGQKRYRTASIVCQAAIVALDFEYAFTCAWQYCDHPSMSSFIVELMYLLTRVYCGCQRWAIRAAHMAATSKEGLLELRRVTESKIDLHEDDNEIPGDVWGLFCDVFEDVRLAKNKYGTRAVSWKLKPMAADAWWRKLPSTRTSHGCATSFVVSVVTLIALI